jgi:hypothetical protein
MGITNYELPILSSVGLFLPPQVFVCGLVGETQQVSNTFGPKLLNRLSFVRV